MNILLLIGSPRKNGNTEYMADKVIEGIMENNDKVNLNKLYLSKMNISPCIACGVCEKEPFCILEDEMQDIYKYIKECDVIMVASPLYFCSVSAQAKACIDRCQMYFNNRVFRKTPIITGDNKKIGIAISSGGSKYPNQFDCLEMTMKFFFTEINADFTAKLYATETDKKHVKEQTSVISEAYEIGRSIANKYER